MTVVPGAREVLGGETPIQGSANMVAPLGVFARDVADDAERFGRHAASAKSALHRQRSLGVTRLVSKIEEALQPGAIALRGSATRGQVAFERFSAEIDEIHQAARAVLAQVDASLGAIRAAAGAIETIAAVIGARQEYAWNEGAPRVLPEPAAALFASGPGAGEAAGRLTLLRWAHEEPWRAAAASWNAAIDDVAVARRRWEDLIEQRKHAETRLRTALSATALGQLISLGPATGQTSAQAIATAIAGEGEGWGVGGSEQNSARSHPLLARLIGTRSGANIWDNPPDPATVAAAWNRLDEDERQTLIERVPWVIGNLPGVPFSARDAANREQLEYFIVHRGDLGPNRQAAVDEIMKVLEKERLQIAVYGQANPPVQLVAFDVAGAVPRAGIAYGDADSAKNLNWMVPGMFNDVNEGLAGWDKAGRNLYLAQIGQLDREGRGTEGSALVAYFEYDTPNLATVLSADTAREAASRLAAELDGAFAVRHANTTLPNHGVLAHSYGTPVAANALLLTKHSVQSFTLIGSAGLDGKRVSSLSELNVDRDAAGKPKVFSTMAAADGTAPFGSNLSGRVQPNPQAAWSGAQVIEGAQLFSTDGLGELKSVKGHSILREDGGGYLDRRTQSLDSVAKLTLGDLYKVSGGLEMAKKRGMQDASARIAAMTLGGP